MARAHPWRPLALAGLLLSICLLVACDESGSSPQAVSRPASKRVKVTREEYGDAWPLTVSEAELELIDGFYAVVHANGRVYAMNGTARTVAQEHGWEDIYDIWREDSIGRVPILPLLNRTLALRGG